MEFVKSTARVYTDHSGAWIEVPVLVSRSGILIPLLDYCISSNRSISWMKKMVHAVSLFLEYLSSNPDEPEHWRLFRNFARRLYTGSYDLETGIDPSYLCWEPRTGKTPREIQFLLTNFFDWLGAANPSAAMLNPRYEGSAFDHRIDQLAYLYRRDRAFLGHTWDVNPNPVHQSNARLTRIHREPKSADARPPEFPSERFEELIFKGFKVGGKYDYRGMLITLLLHGAGFRESEPFHLYMCDVGIISGKNEASALVKIHHPELGEAPNDWGDEKGHPKLGNRTSYLASKWGLSPRTKANGRAAAGWKDPLLDGNYFMRAWWFEPVYGIWFLQLWEAYIKQAVMVERNNPYAFINLDRSPIGGMYKIDCFRAAHKAAVLRIGMQYGKGYGTTEHGHRHAYAQALRRSGVESILIQKFLHHKSIESQSVYTVPTIEESISALSIAANRLRANGQSVTQLTNCDELF